jgi:hypothetical protein
MSIEKIRLYAGRAEESESEQVMLENEDDAACAA